MSAERADRLAALVGEEGLDQLIVGDLVRPGDSGPDAIANARWLTGFTGTSALVVIGPEVRKFMTDFRYAERAEKQVGDAFERVTAGGRLIPELAALLAGRVGFDDTRDERRQPAQARGRARRGGRAGAGQRAGRAAAPAQGRGRAGADRRGGADRRRRLRDGARRGARRSNRGGGRRRRARPYPRARRRALVHGDRRRRAERRPAARRAVGAAKSARESWSSGTWARWSTVTPPTAPAPSRSGEIPDEARAAYELVRTAQAAGLDGGPPRRQREGCRRGGAVGDPRRRPRGRSSATGSATGSGSKSTRRRVLSKRSEDTLAAGDVVTVEPGVYVPGEFGIRIEDLVAVTEDGYRNLSSLGKELRVVD